VAAGVDELTRTADRPLRRRPLRRFRGSHPIVSLVLRRLLQLIPVLVGVSIMTFVLLNLIPGDPAQSILGPDAPQESVDALRDQLQLDRPLYRQYIDWASGALHGDLGTSYRGNNDVWDTITYRVPVSLEIVVVSQVIALALAVPAALLAVRRRNTFVDRSLSMTAFAGLSIPNFLLAFVLILVFAVHWKVLPASGFTRISDGLGKNIKTTILPALALSLSQYAIYMRLLRAEMLETLKEDYITTAYGKGLTPRRVLVRHVMRNSLLALVTVIGVNVGTLLGGAVVTETIFAVPGLGRLLIDSITQRELIVVQGVVLFIAVVYVVLNLVIDLLYSVLDPRIRHGS
jgi:peptide/nickel transport system permease protein